MPDTHERFVELPEGLIKIMTNTKELTIEEHCQFTQAREEIARLKDAIRFQRQELDEAQATITMLQSTLGDSYESTLKFCSKSAAILRELLTLKWHKDTSGETPEYLERMPKAWEAAKEAVL